MKKIGLMGGTFDPIHKAHIEIARRAYEQFNLDEVIFMTGGNPPHKDSTSITDAKIRYEMTNLAIQNEKGFISSDYEVRKTEYSYSVNTLEYLKEKYTDTHIFFMIGEDSLEYIDKWYKPERIFELCTLLVYPRKSTGTLKETVKRVLDTFNGDIKTIEAPVFDISSTDIRKAIADGDDVSGKICESVEDYIKINNLYGSQDYIVKNLEKELAPERFEHSLSVAKTAKKLSLQFGLDEKKAYLAGLLHDCAKYPDKEKMFEAVKKYGVVLDDTTKNCVPVIHAPVGRYVAEKEYGVHDKEILGAIEYHTVAKADMTALEKVIYLADFIEPLRDFCGVDKIRKKASKGLNEAVIEALKQSIEFNTKKGALIHPGTVEALDFLT